MRRLSPPKPRHPGKWVSAGLLLLFLAAVFTMALSRPAKAGQGETITQTVQKGVTFLTGDVNTFSTTNRCVACHRQGGALYGLAVAKSNGYTVDESDTTGIGAIATLLRNDQQNGHWMWTGGTDFAKTGYAFFGLSSYDRNVSTRYSQAVVSAADYAVATQQPGFSYGGQALDASQFACWYEDFNDGVTLNGDVGETARFMVGLAQAKLRVDPVTAAKYEAAIQKAANWIRYNRANLGAQHLYDPSEAYYRQLAANDRANADYYRSYGWWDSWYFWYADYLEQEAAYYDQLADQFAQTGFTPNEYTYEIAYGILGLKAAGAANNDPDVLTLRDRLLNSISRPTGRAWGYTVNDAADGYPTGLALYALCQVGVELRDSPTVQDAAYWLRDTQGPDGNWGAGTGSMDIQTTFAVLGLSCYGELGVHLEVEGADHKVVHSNDPSTQSAVYTLTVENHGAFDFTDTYDLTVQGGFGGWTGTLSSAAVTLLSGKTAELTFTVTVPPNQPEALPVEMTVIATSRANPKVSSSVKLTTYTDPPPPSSGHPTVTTLTQGPGAVVASRQAGQPLSATVRADDGSQVVGPGRGVVTFYVAGVVVGTDRDADGDGVYSVNWVPGASWRVDGVQDLRAVYSGIELGDVNRNLMPSLAASTLTISLPKNSPPHADAGANQTVEAAGPQTAVQLNGSASSDPDGDALDFVWKEGNAVVGVGANPSVQLGVGVHVLALTVTDPSGETDTASVTVTVKDTTAPKITAPTNAAANTDAGLCTAVVNPGAASAVDSVDGALTPAGARSDGKLLTDPYPVGATTITWSVKDGAGNSASATQTVTVTDAEKPKLTVPGDVTRGNDAGKCSASVNPGQATATDNCGVLSVVGVRSDGKSLTEAYPVGATVITWTATDVNGNTSTSVQKVTVNDVEAPVLTGAKTSPDTIWPPDHKMVPVTVSYGVTDNCDSNVSLSLSISCNQAVNGLADGNTSVDWKVIDAHHVQVRSERSGTGTDRVYTITITAVDSKGNRSVKAVTVTVPKDQSK